MFHLKKYRGVIFDCNQDWYKVWRNTGLCFQNLTWVIWQIFTRAIGSLQIGTLIASFCLKLKIYELLLDRGVMCHGNEEWCKIWRGIDLSVQNWHEEWGACAFKNGRGNLANFHQSMFGSLKIGVLMGSFYPK